MILIFKAIAEKYSPEFAYFHAVHSIFANVKGGSMPISPMNNLAPAFDKINFPNEQERLAGQAAREARGGGTHSIFRLKCNKRLKL